MSEEFPFEHFLNLNSMQKQKSPPFYNSEVSIPQSIDEFNHRLNEPLSEQNAEEFHSDLLSHEELLAIQNEILFELKKTLPEIKFKTYFENNLYLKSIHEHRVIFEAKTQFIKKALENFLSEIQTALELVLGKTYDIHFTIQNQIQNSEVPQRPYSGLSLPPLPAQSTVSQKSNPYKIGEINSGTKIKFSDYLNADDSTMKSPVKSAKESKFILDLKPTFDDLKNKAESQFIEHMKQPVTSKISIDPNKTFQSFIIGPSNRHAYASTQAIAKNPGNKGQYSTLYLHSNSGLGKTHLLHAVCNEIKEKYPELTICFTTGRAFMEELVEHTRMNTIHEFRKKYAELIDVLIIDDIHEISNKTGTQDEFFHAFNELHNKGKQLIFTSDRKPKEIDGISERIQTRLSWGLVIDIQPPDIETRMAILKHKASDLDLYVNEEIINYIASHIKTNIRELEGSLIRLKAYAEIQNSEVEIELAKDILNLTEGQSENTVTVESIAKATAQYYKIQLVDLKSKIRNQETTKARHVAMYLIRKKLQTQYQEIGQFFGGRDHSSVIHAVRSIEDALKNQNQNHLSRDLYTIENSL